MLCELCGAPVMAGEQDPPKYNESATVAASQELAGKALRDLQGVTSYLYRANTILSVLLGLTPEQVLDVVATPIPESKLRALLQEVLDEGLASMEMMPLRRATTCAGNRLLGVLATWREEARRTETEAQILTEVQRRRLDGATEAQTPTEG